jgi:hypothetical protein
VPLCHVLRGGHAKGRHLLFVEVIGDRQRLEGGEWADDAMDVVLLDQFLRFAARGCRCAGRVGHDRLDLAAGDGVVAFLEEHGQGEIHVDAAGGQRPGLGGQHADADRSAVLGTNRIAHRQAGDTRAGNAADKLPSR